MPNSSAPNLSTSQTQFARKLGYVFQDINLLATALTHRSVHKANNYERLEFLGDALLSVIIAKKLYHQFPNEPEGQLTRMRATLVRQETLAKVARDLSLGGVLNLGLGEQKAGGRERDSILSDVVEAIIGAIYLDSNDLTILTNIVLGWFDSYIVNINQNSVLKDAKSRLQERLQADKKPLPTYELIKIEGKAPNQVFHVVCTADYILPQSATGKSRRIAEQNAALAALTAIEKLNH